MLVLGLNFLKGHIITSFYFDELMVNNYLITYLMDEVLIY